jgi:hypothetical protein
VGTSPSADLDLGLVEFPQLRDELNTRMRLRQDTLNLAALAQVALLTTYIALGAIFPERTKLGNLLLLPAFIAIIFEIMLLDHQVKGMVQTSYMKLSGYSQWAKFYDKHTYEHPGMRWVKSPLGLVDPCILAIPGLIGLVMYASQQGADGAFWIELVILVALQPIALAISLYLTRLRIRPTDPDNGPTLR